MPILYEPPGKLSVRDQFYEELAYLTEEEQKAVLSRLSEQQLWELNNAWVNIARPQQLLPKDGWTVAVLRAGRGWGKTRCGAEWLANEIRTYPGTYGLFGQTMNDVRTTMLEDESGLLQCFRGEHIDLKHDKRDIILTFPNGSKVYAASGDNPRKIRGKNLMGIWYDELSEYSYIDEVWTASRFALRKGRSKSIITTTPKAKSIRFLRELEAKKTTLLVRGSSYDNMANLSEPYKEIISDFEGTRTGRQEINADLLETDRCLWNDGWFQHRPIDPSKLDRIVVAVDPAASDTKNSAESGIIVAGLARANKSSEKKTEHQDRGWVLSDRSLKGSPELVVKRAIEAYYEFDAECIVLETNNGGKWLPLLFQNVDPNVPIKSVTASESKRVRAEPVALLYELGRIFHTNNFKELENQMLDFDASEPRQLKDRLDAAVWGLSYLLTHNRKAKAQAHSLGLW